MHVFAFPRIVSLKVIIGNTASLTVLTEAVWRKVSKLISPSINQAALRA